MSVIHIKDTEEYNKYIKETKDKLVVVDYSAVWCGPCKYIAKPYEKLSEEKTDAIFLKVDIDECKDIADDEQIMGVPTFKFWKNGALVDELVGADQRKLRELTEKHI
ncbi:thioredoxin-like protein [Anaeramoeba ignava]|uniref:Thioredoxin n=1 Tax=Anaeramoeba ignava TaxID=1746090 RepID=A0A9Q0LG13_ANAIG|nr:thioredoxin-like protein [Anaeramoeba ignava]